MKHLSVFLKCILPALLAGMLTACAPVKGGTASLQESTPCPVIAEETQEPECTPAPTQTPAPVLAAVQRKNEIRGLTVSEILPAAKAVRLEDGSVCGFVELYNGSDAPASLEGLYLSDDPAEPEKYPLPAETVPAHGYYLVRLDDASGAAFSLSSSDTCLQLYGKEERLVVRYPLSSLPGKDISFVPATDGTLSYCLYPTPGRENAPVYASLETRDSARLRSVYFSEVSTAGEEWIELANGGNEPLSLEGWYWTKEATAPVSVPLSGSIEAGAVAVFSTEAFSLSASGETLYLYDADSLLRDSFSTGVLSAGITSGRSGSMERVFFTEPSPGSPNTGGSSALLTPEPVFSETGLYASAPFSLKLTCSDPSATIYYTVNGSEPTVKSTVYTEPIAVDKTVSVRAMAVSPGKDSSKTVSAHFILGAEHTLPVFCIDMDPAHFRSLSNAPYDESGLQERPAYVTYYEADGQVGAAFPAGIKPRGNASITYKQKSLSLHLRADYGQKSVSCDFWNEGTTGPYTALVLRNSGQDTNVCHLRDAFSITASKNLRVDTQLTRPVVVYINGTYYGLLDLNENMNKAWLAQHYGVDESTVNIVQRNSYVNTGSSEGFVALRKFAASHDFSDDAVLEEFSQSIDLDAVTDYLFAQSFFGNYDIHNQNYWSTSDLAVTWRPFLYDVDRSLNKTSMKSNVLAMYFNKDGIVHDRAGDRIYMEIYCALKENATWRDSFLKRCAELLCSDFSEETLLTLFDSMAAALRPEMERHTEKWGTPQSLRSWEQNIASMRENIEGSSERMQKHIRSVFRLSEEEWAEYMALYQG